MKQIPIYLFLGFLDSGKTSFIQETMQDERFKAPGKTLIILCEEGEKELDSDKFCCNADIITIDDADGISTGNLKKLEKQYNPDRILIEYNGMWTVEQLGRAMPRNWMVYQVMMFADSSSFSVYNANMRSLMVEKMIASEMVIFNRCTPETDKSKLLQSVRAANMSADIAYEYTDGTVDFDEPELKLPYDIDSELIKVGLDDFGIWYLDSMNHPEKYKGKKINIDGMVYKTDKVNKGSFVFGRPAMTCCADDISFIGFICDSVLTDSLKDRIWINITAEMGVRSHPMYGGEGPFLKVIELRQIDKPKDEVVTF